MSEVNELRLEEVEAILPDGWDGTSDFLESEPSLESLTVDPEDEGTETVPVAPVETPEIPAETEAPTTEPEAPAKMKVKVKFNHEELEMDEDEAAPLIQKGLNYQKIADKAESLEKQLSEYDDFAKTLSYTSTSEMMDAAKLNYFNVEVEKLVNDGVHQAIAEDLVRRSFADKAVEKAKAPVIDQEKVAAELKQKQRDDDLDAFVKAYPGVTTLPPEVHTMYNTGVPLTTAYERYKNTEAQRELQVLRQNQAAAAKAPVGGTTKNGPTAVKAEDPFLAGFESDKW